MGVVEELLGCSLLQITRSFWAVRLKNKNDSYEWVCEARTIRSWSTGSERWTDWTQDLVSTGDVHKIDQLWLLCPPTFTSPLGNAAHLSISEAQPAFQLKVGTVDTSIAETSRAVQAHMIGRVLDRSTGDCEAFIFDYAEQGLLTPYTPVYDPATGLAKVDASGQPVYAGRSNIHSFHSWRSGIAPLGRIEIETVGIRL